LIDPNGLDCVYASGAYDNSKIDACSDNKGTYVSGKVHTIFHNQKTDLFQVASYDKENIYYSLFAPGAKTEEVKSAYEGIERLTSMIVGPGDQDGLMTFMAKRHDELPFIWRYIAGPLNGKNNWAGPGGMGVPQGPGDWAAIVHDYNFYENGIRVIDYINFNIPKSKADALIQSNNNIIRNAGGIAQTVKFGAIFGLINGYQSSAHSQHNRLEYTFWQIGF